MPFFYNSGKNSGIKEQAVMTPVPLANWLMSLVARFLPDGGIIFDPAVGSGNLLLPFKEAGYLSIGCDIQNFEPDIDKFYLEDFLSWKHEDKNLPIDFVICNPPYNHSQYSKKYGVRNLLPQLFIEHIFHLCSQTVKAMFFVPMGFRLNTQSRGKGGGRYKAIRDKYPPITSILSLPMDIMPNPNYRADVPLGASNSKRVLFHQEIIIFNMPDLPAHISVPERVIQDINAIY